MPRPPRIATRQSWRSCMCLGEDRIGREGNRGEEEEKEKEKGGPGKEGTQRLWQARWWVVVRDRGGRLDTTAHDAGTGKSLGARGRNRRQDEQKQRQKQGAECRMQKRKSGVQSNESLRVLVSSWVVGWHSQIHRRWHMPSPHSPQSRRAASLLVYQVARGAGDTMGSVFFFSLRFRRPRKRLGARACSHFSGGQAIVRVRRGGAGLMITACGCMDAGDNIACLPRAIGGMTDEDVGFILLSSLTAKLRRATGVIAGACWARSTW